MCLLLLSPHMGGADVGRVVGLPAEELGNRVPLPKEEQQFSTMAGAVAMDALACGFKLRGSLQHGRVGAGLTLTLDTAVGRVHGGGPGKVVKKKRAKAEGNLVPQFFCR